MRKKLGFFRKILAKVGKKVMWVFSRKVNRLLLHSAWKEVLLTFANLPGADLNQACKIWYELGKGAGDALMYAWQERISLLYSKKLEDMKIMVETAWHAFLGDNPDEIEFFEGGLDEKGEQQPPRVVFRFNKCWICSEIAEDKDFKDYDLSNTGEFGYGACASGIFETALQQVQDYVENPYTVKVRETKCFLRGDDCMEFTVFFYPKE